VSDFSDYKVGQKIGVRPRYSYQEGETVVGEITGESRTLWTVQWESGIGQWGRFKKDTGVNFPRESSSSNDLFLCTEQEAIDILKKYNERIDREYCQRKASDLNCTYSQEFQNELLALIKKHKRTK
jgi:hypothetical protein